jgi:fatty acid hydroxylase domain-containing protein 2
MYAYLMAWDSFWKFEEYSSPDLGFLAGYGVPDIITHSLQDKERLFFVGVTVLLLEICFWGFAFFYMVAIDHFNVFGWKRFKFSTTQPPSNDLVWNCFIDVLTGHIFVRPLLLFIAYPFLRAHLTFSSASVPNFYTVLWQLFVCVQVDDFLFYWSHRMLHHPLIYRYIHKKHHNFKHTIAIAVEWAHPIEELLSNTLPSIVSASIFTQ